MSGTDTDRFSQWKAGLQSSNMVTVLNAMEEIVGEGDWSALGLLTIAGDNVTGIAKQLPIKTPNGNLKLEQFRQYCIERLQQRLGAKLPTQSAPTRARVFISYNHQDREAANALALELARAKADVFLDHWAMAPQEEILSRVEQELNASDVVIALLSPRSAASAWVQRELEIVIKRQEAEGRVMLLPVLIEDCPIPQAIAARPYYDLRDARNGPMVAQAIVNRILGIKPFSERAAEFLNSPDPNSPYSQHARDNGRRLLQELAKHHELEIANNQKWLLWEFYHKLLPRYTCTLKMGLQESKELGEHYAFAIVDRWNGTINSVALTPKEFDRGLWHGEIDLLGRRTLSSSSLQFVGSLGRLALDSTFNPNVDFNTAEATSRQPMSAILRSFLQVCDQFDEGDLQCFLFNYQRLLAPADWHRVKVVVGSTVGGARSMANSMAARELDEPFAIFELYDPLFASLKYTSAYKHELEHLLEGDVDLMSAATTVSLGYA